MRSGLAIEMRIWSKLCGPETCPKMFINSFIEDPFALKRHARESGHPGQPLLPLGAWTPASAGVTEKTFGRGGRAAPATPDKTGRHQAISSCAAPVRH